MKKCFLIFLVLGLFQGYVLGCSSDSTPQESVQDGGVADSVPSEVAPDGGSGQAQALLRLKAKGVDIVDTSGKKVLLRGVNLGAWNFHETWISLVDYPVYGRLRLLAYEAKLGAEVDKVLKEIGKGEDAAWQKKFFDKLKEAVGEAKVAALKSEFAKYPSIYDDSDLPLRQLLEKRFGNDGKYEILDAFQKAWIKESDIKWLAEQGFNVVRVPMTYRSLVIQTDMKDPSSLVWNEKAFTRINELLKWCEKYKIYAILDIQECPGGQNKYTGTSTLYQDPKMQQLTIDLWLELSRRYKDRNVVAAYSLLAEPMSAPTTKDRDDMYDRLIKAIRAKGDDHLLIIHDGFKKMNSLPNPSEKGWEQVVYSTHIFEWGAKSLSEYDLYIKLVLANFKLWREKQNVPYYIGSFSTMQDKEWAYQSAEKLVKYYNQNGMSWSLWTFKRIDNPVDKELWGESTAWGLLGRLEGKLERVDIHRDDKATILKKLSNYANLNLKPNTKLLKALAQPVP